MPGCIGEQPANLTGETLLAAQLPEQRRTLLLAQCGGLLVGKAQRRVQETRVKQHLRRVAIKAQLRSQHLHVALAAGRRRVVKLNALIPVPAAAESRPYLRPLGQQSLGLVAKFCRRIDQIRAHDLDHPETRDVALYKQRRVQCRTDNVLDTLYAARWPYPGSGWQTSHNPAGRDREA